MAGALSLKSPTLPRYTCPSRTQLVCRGAKHGKKPNLDFLENTNTIVVAAEVPLSEKYESVTPHVTDVAVKSCHYCYSAAGLGAIKPCCPYHVHSEIIIVLKLTNDVRPSARTAVGRIGRLFATLKEEITCPFAQEQLQHSFGCQGFREID